MTELARMNDFSLDWLQEEAPRAPILRYKQGEYICPALFNDDNLKGGLFVPSLPSLRDTITAWVDGQNYPVEEHEAFVFFGEKLPTQLNAYPSRADGKDAWVAGQKIDGMLYVEGSDWQPVTLVAGTATSMIQVKEALKKSKQQARSYPVAQWSPVWQMRGGNFYENPTHGKVKIPLYELVGMVKSDGTVKALEPGFDMTPCETLGERVPTPEASVGMFALPSGPSQGGGGAGASAMAASGVVVPGKPGGASMAADVDDDIPF
jgi:hypothetical protein